jgi:hypothetical protein
MKKLALAIVAASAFVAVPSFAQVRPEPPRGRVDAPPPPPPEPRPEPPTGRAEAGEREFGNPGVLAFGGTTSAVFAYQNTSPPTGSSTNAIELGLQPDIQYFVIEGLSLGGTINFNWVHPNQGGDSTTFGIGPTVGYNVWITPGSLSLWPQATFSFNNTSLSVPNATGGGTTSATLQTMNVGVMVPLLIHPAKHFHFGVGPFFNIDVSSKETLGSAPAADYNKLMNVGLAVDVGGWL